MKRVPANRYVIFFLIAGCGLLGDLWSKSVVFEDLGYPGGRSVLDKTPGNHLLFESPQFSHGETVPYINNWLTFRLFTSFNHGALWGIGQGFSWVFASLSVVAIVGVLYWLFLHGAARSLWLTVALAFILAGTFGNLYDRLGLHGCVNPSTGEELRAVRDFLLFTFGTFSWPVFNIADVCLVTGAIMLVLQSFWATESSHQTENAAATAENSSTAKAAE